MVLKCPVRSTGKLSSRTLTECEGLTANWWDVKLYINLGYTGFKWVYHSACHHPEPSSLPGSFVLLLPFSPSPPHVPVLRLWESLWVMMNLGGDHSRCLLGTSQNSHLEAHRFWTKKLHCSTSLATSPLFLFWKQGLTVNPNPTVSTTSPLASVSQVLGL